MINHIGTNQYVLAYGSLSSQSMIAILQRGPHYKIPVYQETFTSTTSFLNLLTTYIKM